MGNCCGSGRNISVTPISENNSMYYTRCCTFTPTLNKNKISSLLKQKQTLRSSLRNTTSNNENKKYFEKLNKDLYTPILDYLSFPELKEVGRVNRKFNRAVRSSDILIKFFKNKHFSIKSSLKNNSFVFTFSQSKKNTKSYERDFSFNEFTF